VQNREKRMNKSDIQKLDDNMTAAFNRGDLTTFLSNYKADAVLLPPGAEMIKGKADIEAFWKKGSEAIGEARLTVLDVKPLGNLAVQEVGSFNLKTKSQPPQEMVGKYLVIWEKVDTDWKIAADMWNTNA
jgi:ketosteroid isomerase-like protein